MNSIPPVLLTHIIGLETHVPQIASTVADNLRFVTPTATIEQGLLLAFLRALYAAFPGWHYDHAAPDLQGDHFAVPLRQSGTALARLPFPARSQWPRPASRCRSPEEFNRGRDDPIVEIRPDPIPGGAS